MTVICPNCGGEITAPKKKVKSIKCPRCDMAGLDFGLDYFDEGDNPKQSFSEKHPKLTQAGCAAFAGACTVFALWAKNKDLFTAEPTTEYTPIADSDSKTFPEENTPANPIQTNAQAYVNPDDYESVLREHGLSFRNLGESRFRSIDKEKQIIALGMKGLDPHITVVDPFPQHHRVKKQEV